MVSYEELIYHFTDIYLKSAMECSICKENYTMTDDKDFLDEYMKIFLSLLSAVEQDYDLDVESIKERLLKLKNEKIIEFQAFLKHKLAEQALEKAQKDLMLRDVSEDCGGIYTDKIREFFQETFDEECKLLEEHPVELLQYVRAKEEIL